MKDTETAIIVLSCDHYSDLWSVFFNTMENFWSNNNFQIFLVTNFKNPNFRNVEIINIGEDLSWSDNLISTLKKLDSYKYVIVMTEDGFLFKSVNNHNLNLMIDAFKKLNGNCLAFLNDPKPEKKINDFFGEIPKWSPYRSTTTHAIWNRKHLLSILNPGESAWEFEKKGSRRTDNFSGYYSTWEKNFYLIHGVIKGKWLRKSISQTKKIYPELIIERPAFSFFEELKWNSYVYIRKLIFLFTPKKLRKYLVRNI